MSSNAPHIRSKDLLATRRLSKRRRVRMRCTHAPEESSVRILAFRVPTDWEPETDLRVQST